MEVFEANGKDVARAKDREMAQEALKNGFTVNLRGLPYRYSPVLVIRIFKIKMLENFWEWEKFDNLCILFFKFSNF